jgi:large subunit ribosomal protein L2
LIIKNFSLTQKKYASAASRNITCFPSENIIFKKYRNLTVKKKNTSGRSNTGKIIFRTKTSFLFKKKHVAINYSLQYRHLGTIASFTFIPYKNRLLSLVFFCNGMASYFLATNSQILFSFFYVKLPKSLSKVHLPLTHCFLFQIKKLSFVSCLEKIPGKGAQLVRSTGTKAKLMALDDDTRSCTIKLPSGLKKIFSYYSFAFFEQLAIPFHKRRKNGKAGFWRKFGKKSTVRGVAMNAVDHPHGGRTKSIKTPLTPWGKITKFK